MSINVRKKNFKKIKHGTVIGISGRRGSGKTTVVKTLMYYFSPSVRIPLLISGTADYSNDFRGIVPPVLVYDKYNPDKMKALIFSQSALKDKSMRGKKKYSLVVMDDVISQKKRWANDTQFIKMFLEGRHFDITNILCIHDPLNIPSALRSNIDYLIITAEHRATRIKSLYENYWPQKFGDLNTFKEILNTTTEGYKSLFIDIKRSSAPHATFENSIFYIAPPHPDNIPHFKLGIKELWELNKEYYNSHWRSKEYTKKSANLKPKITLK